MKTPQHTRHAANSQHPMDDNKENQDDGNTRQAPPPEMLLFSQPKRPSAIPSDAVDYKYHKSYAIMTESSTPSSNVVSTRHHFMSPEPASIVTGTTTVGTPTIATGSPIPKHDHSAAYSQC
jgi:hypothetical protein